MRNVRGHGRVDAPVADNASTRVSSARLTSQSKRASYNQGFRLIPLSVETGDLDQNGEGHVAE